MKQATKLKPINWGRSVIFGVIGIVLFVSVFAIIRTTMAERTADVLCGIIYLVVTAVCVFSWIKAKQVFVFPIMLMNLMVALNFFVGLQTFTVISVFTVIITVCLFTLFIYMFFVYLKHTGYSRRILERAARPVDDAKNGFTRRPFPLGKAVYSKGELFGFAEFLKSCLIAIPFVESNGITLAFPEDWLGRLYDMHGSYLDDTRIIFQFSGQVSTHITEKDYKKYQEELTFDQLCSSLGNIFIEFMELYKNGEGDRILEKIKR
jgi:Ca2+/Na+ antiporter